MKKLLIALFVLLPVTLWAQTTAEPYAVLSQDSLTVTFYYDDQKSARGGIDINNPGYGSYESAVTAVFDASFANYQPTSTAFWFRDCSSLTTISGLEHLKTDSVTNMSLMFYGCSSLTRLNVSGFNTANVTRMRSMFEGCSSLTTIYVDEGWSTTAVTDSRGMFTDCSSLVGGSGTPYDASHTDHTYAHIDGGTANPGYFTAKK